MKQQSWKRLAISSCLLVLLTPTNLHTEGNETSDKQIPYASNVEKCVDILMKHG